MRLFDAEKAVKDADRAISPMDCAFQTHFTGLGSNRRVGGFARLDAAEKQVAVCKAKWLAALEALKQELLAQNKHDKAAEVIAHISKYA